MVIFGITVVVIAVFMLVGSIVHTTYFKGKLGRIKPYGRLIDVDGG